MKKISTLIFIAVCAVILIVLLKAPPVKTPRTPDDSTHADPKKFERCPSCHLPGGEGPRVREDHLKDGQLLPSHAKCYMCHKPKNM